MSDMNSGMARRLIGLYERAFGAVSRNNNEIVIDMTRNVRRYFEANSSIEISQANHPHTPSLP